MQHMSIAAHMPSHGHLQELKAQQQLLLLSCKTPKQQHTECLRIRALREGSTSVSCLQEPVGASQQLIALQTARQSGHPQRRCLQRKQSELDCHLDCCFSM